MQNTTKRDFIYCDPPYINRYSDYYNGWTEADEQNLYDCLNSVGCKFILSSWHHNKYRENKYIENSWKNFNLHLINHKYFVGGKKESMNDITEVLITNF